MNENVQVSPNFLEALDTVDVERKKQTRVTSEVQLNLMLGKRVILSQTQAFDGKHFLAYAASPSFRDIISGGQIVVNLLPGQLSLRHALLTAARKPGFHFSGLNIPNPIEKEEFRHQLHVEVPDKERFEPKSLKQRLACAEAIHRAITEPLYDGKHLKEFGALLPDQWDTICAVDSAREVAQKSKAAYTPIPKYDRKPLREVMQEGSNLPLAGQQIRDIRKRVLTVEGGHDRSFYFKAIESHLGFDRQEQEEAHTFVNNAYNRVIAESLGVLPTADTFSQYSAAAASEEASAPIVEVTQETMHGLLKEPRWDHMSEIVKHLNSGEPADSIAKHLVERTGLMANIWILENGEKLLSLSLGNLLADKAYDVGVSAVLTIVATNFNLPLEAIAISGIAGPVLAAILRYKGIEMPFDGVIAQRRQSERKRVEAAYVNLIKGSPDIPRDVRDRL